MKHITKSLSIALVLLMLLSVFAVAPITASANVSGNYEYILEDSTAEITGYTGNDAVLDIPTEIDGYTVTRIGDEAFRGCKSLTSVTIGNSVESIEYKAFYGCTSLTNITIPDSVTWIENYAFAWCESLESVTIGNSVTRIRDDAFYGCTSLTNITIPDSVTWIGESAFEDCTSLTDVYYSGTIQQWNNIDIESYNQSLTGATIHCSDGVINENNAVEGETSGDYRYTVLDDDTAVIVSYNGSDNVVDIPQAVQGHTVTAIGSYAFRGCTVLNIIIIPCSVTKIEYGAFAGCNNITDIYYYGENGWDSDIDIDGGNDPSFEHAVQHWSRDYPNEAVSNIIWNIDDSGTLYISGKGMINPNESSTEEQIPWYSQRESIKNVVVSEGITGVGNYSFWNCNNIETISLPSTVTYWGGEACFSGTLQNISVRDGNEAFTSVDGVLFNKDMTEIIKYPNGRSGKYTIPDTVESIYRGAFRKCKNLTNIEFPDSITSIEMYTFYDCDSLMNVTIPGTVTNIENRCGLGLKFHKAMDEKIEGFVIYGEIGSAAETYATNNGLKFVSLEGSDTPAPTEEPTQPTTACNHSHTKTTTTAATYFASGKKVVTCADCGKVINTTSIAKKTLKTPTVTVKAAKKSIKVSYEKSVKDATGFVVKYQIKGTKKVYTKTYKSNKRVTKIIGNLKSNKKYTVSVRAYVKSGKKIAYSKWTDTTVKVK